MRRLVFTIAILCPVLLYAVDTNQNRGFSPDKIYQVGDIDSVNPFNGNLIVRIPLGPAYTVSPTLSYQFTLAYNSTVWDYEYDTTMDPDVPDRRAIPERHSNVGLGWTLTLGRLIQPRATTSSTPGHGWLYLAPDGSHHEFFFDTVTVPIQDATAGVSYTRDGSYLRKRDSVPGSNAQYTVDFPDGTVKHFNTSGDLLEIRDRFDNWVKIDYASAPNRWEVTDGYGSAVGRTHYIDVVTGWEYTNFNNTVITGSYNQSNLQTRIGGLDLAGFNGARSTYTFSYTHPEIPRGGCETGIPTDPPNVRAPLLQTITFPDADGPAGSPAEVYNPEYYTEGNCQSGALKGLQLPTLAWLRYTYGAYELPTQDCHPEDFWVQTYLGVTGRQLRDKHTTIDTAAVLATWTYQPQLVSRGTEPATQKCRGVWYPNILKPPQEFINVITAPDQVAAKHYFSVFPQGAATQFADGFTGSEYGLPMTRKVVAAGRPLSREVFRLGSSEIEQKVYSLYETDVTGTGTTTTWNSREKAHRVVYPADLGCDGECYIDTERSDFDGYGHYRTTLQSSNVPSTPNRTVKTMFNPGSGTNGQRTDGTPFFGTSSAWLLNTYTETSTEQAGTLTAKSLTTFDSQGVLTGTRMLQGTTAANGDIYVALCHDGRGYLTSERTFGGDTVGGGKQAIPASNWCGTAPREGEYAVQYDYTTSISSNLDSPRASRTARYLDRNGAPMENTATTEEYDVATGLVKATVDPALVRTGYTYDILGRFSTMQQSGNAETGYTYTTATYSTPPTAQAVQTSWQGAGEIRQRYEYDMLGRLAKQITAMPDGVLVNRTLEYDATGRLLRVSEPSVGSPAFWTSYEYDALGRATKVTQPDGTYTDSAYTGSRIVLRTAAIGSLPQRAATRETYDGLGRLITVEQLQCATCPLLSQAAYSYDGADRLSNATVSAPNGTSQSRTFTYDNRGFLTSESHPEVGTTTYADHDVRGRARLRLVTSAMDIFDLQFTYDAAERLVQVKSRSAPGSPSFRLSKEFSFGTENVGDNLARGKLASATRHNYQPTLGDVQVIETYKYKDAAGRMTDKDTRIVGGPLDNRRIDQTFRQSYTYNDLNLLSSTTYPACMTVGCGRAGWTTIDSVFDAGRLEAVPGFATKVVYQPNGMTNTVWYANGTSDVQTPDPHGMARPNVISVVGSTSCAAPTITSPPASQTVIYGDSTSLSVAASGSAPATFQWYEFNTKIEGATFSTYTTPPLTAPTEYSVRVTNSCGTVTSAPAVVTVELRAPTNLMATYNGAGAVALSWTAAADAHHYQIERRSNGSAFAPLPNASPTGTSYTDTTVGSDTAYVYRIRSADSGNQVLSQYSNLDLATTKTFTNVSAGMVVNNAHPNEVLAAVNIVRAANGASSVSWSAILPSGVPAPAAGTLIYRAHIESLRTAMNQAVQALGLAAPAYDTDPTITTATLIKAAHMNELTARTQ